LGFSSTSNGAVGRIEDIARNISVASATNVSLVNNKACGGVSSSDEAQDLKAEEGAKRAEEN